MSPRPLLTVALLGLGTPALAHDHDGHQEAHSHYDSRHQDRAPVGLLQVMNRAGAVMTVYIDGQAPRTLVPNQTLAVETLAGDTRVRSTYRLFGQERTLEDQRVYVRAGRTESVVLDPPTSARVLLRNNTPFMATILADGREVGTLGAGQERIQSFPARPTTLTLLANGHVLRTERLAMRPFDEPVVQIVMPSTGDLVVVNPLPIPVQLTGDRGLRRTVEPYGRVALDDLPLGSFHITARRLTGERIDDEVARVDPWVTTSWRVDAPQDGLVLVDNHHWLDVRLYVDGRVETTLAAERDRRLLLPLGWHHVEARDSSGREILDTWIEVDRFDEAEVDVGRRHNEPVATTRDYDHHTYADRSESRR